MQITSSVIFAFLRGRAGLFALAAAAAAFLRAFSSAFFRLRSARHAANFALTLPKPLGHHCMECDFSWDVSAKSYEGLYNVTANLW